MYRVYFKQAIRMLKQNRFISIITIAGTALAIMMVMALIITEEIKNRNIAPEINRANTLYIKYQCETGRNEPGLKSGYVQYDYYKHYLSGFKTPLLTSAFTPLGEEVSIVQAENSRQRLGAYVLKSDADFWELMSFSFIEGNAFSREDFNDGLCKAVISDKLARELFKKETALGKTVNIAFRPYEIIGVVKEVSKAFQYAYADLWIPYTSIPGYENYAYHILYQVADKKDIVSLSEEVRESEKKFNATNDEWDLVFRGPYNHRTQYLAEWSNYEPEIIEHVVKTALIFSILLLIPAVNLSSFSIARIKRRVEEIGIRKAFGARKSVILIQVLYENLITSLIGGVIGLIFSYGIVVWLKGWLLDIPPDSSIPVNALISLSVFFYVFAVCVLLNLISAAIPAYKASKINIVDSLNQNNR